MSVKFRYIWIGLFLITFLGSCSVIRKGSKKDYRYGDLRFVVNEHIKNSNKRNYILIESANIEINAGSKVSAKMNFYAERDEMIFASVRFLGFEVMRMMITNDSVKYINRAERTYFFESMEEVKNKYPDITGFDNIQALLFTGFYNVPYGRQHSFFRNSMIENDTVFYKDHFKEGIYAYSKYLYPDMALMLFEYNNLPLTIRSRIQIERDKNEVKTCNGFLQKELFMVEYTIKIREIKNKKYQKTDFKIGKNYKKISVVF